jgi:hypothetical protein
LSLPSAKWGAERAASYRYLAKCDPNNAEEHLLNAIKEDPTRRESKVEIASHYYNKQDWNLCYSYATEAIEIKEKPLDYLCEEFAWGALPFDLASISAWNLKDYKSAKVYGDSALLHEPTNDRLKKNLMFFTEALQK